jgi:outer membrane biosynthesis protein TonB
MNEAHERFQEWLTAGAEGDPPRDVAVHASVCPVCSQSIAALDLLAVVDPGLAAMPAPPIGAERGRMALAGRLVGATAVLFAAAMLGVGVSGLIGVSRTGGPVAQSSRSPEQSVLAGTATPEPTPEPTPSPSQETLSPLATPAPTTRPPVATPRPYVPPPPTPIPTAVATPVPLPSDTPLPTDTATPVPSETPVPTPTPIPSESATPAASGSP